MRKILGSPTSRQRLFALALAMIVCARLLTFSSWAEQNAVLASILYAWIVFEALALLLISDAHRKLPSAYKLIATTALAGALILLTPSAPLRSIYMSQPAVFVTAGVAASLLGAMSFHRFFAKWVVSGSIELGFREILPGRIVTIAINELEVIKLGLFRWNEPVDVRSHPMAFTYHRYLNPLLGAFLFIQFAEISLVHFFLYLWNPIVAWIVLAVSIYAVIWTVALMKSFRDKPVLLGSDALHVRWGFLYDFRISLDAIKIREDLPMTKTKGDSTLTLVLMSTPNVILELEQSVKVPTFLGRTRDISCVAIRLDDSEEFFATISQKMARSRVSADRDSPTFCSSIRV